MKGKRQEKILELIQAYDIETQEELSKRLSENGFMITQGTISRDIRELKITKVPAGNGKQKYAPMIMQNVNISDKYRRVLSEGILHIEKAQNILVVKTVSGMAMACAAALDHVTIPGLVGCIAGDDTVMCVAKDNTMADSVMSEMNKIIKMSV